MKTPRRIIHLAAYVLYPIGGRHGAVCHRKRVLDWSEKTDDPAKVTCKSCLRVIVAVVARVEKVRSRGVRA